MPNYSTIFCIFTLEKAVFRGKEARKRAVSLIELEVSLGVVVRDILYHTSENLHITWQQTLLYVVAEDITEDTTEILMTRIAQERTRVSEHTYETAQQSKY